MALRELRISVTADLIKVRERKLLSTHEYWKSPVPCSVAVRVWDPDERQSESVVVLFHLEISHSYGSEWYLAGLDKDGCEEAFVRYLAQLDEQGWDVIHLIDKWRKHAPFPRTLNNSDGQEGRATWQVESWFFNEKGR